MIIVKNISIAYNGKYTRVSASYDELDDNGKTIATNKIKSRVVTDQRVLGAIETINEYAESFIEEDK